MSISTMQWAVSGWHEGTDPVTNEPTRWPKYDHTKRVEDKVQHVGTTLCDREENYYDDSDGYAHVWTPEQGISRVLTWTTRFAENHAGTKVDAYDPQGEHYAAMVDEHVKALGAILAERAWAGNLRALNEAFVPAKGDYVRVARGRKVPVGTEGVVIWTGERSYSQWQAKYGSPNLRLGIRDAQGEVWWVDAKNVDMVDEPVYALMSEDADEWARIVRERSQGNLKALHSEYCGSVSRLAYVR